MGDAAHRHIQSNLEHQLLEALAILTALDGVRLGANHLHAVPLEHAGAEKLHRRVKPRLAAEGGQQHKLAIRANTLQFLQLADDDFLHRLGCDRLDVSAVGKLRVGHDGGGVGIHQHHAIALFLESLTRLRTRIVKLARLPNNNWTGPDDEYRMNVVPSWHEPRRLNGKPAPLS